MCLSQVIDGLFLFLLQMMALRYLTRIGEKKSGEGGQEREVLRFPRRLFHDGLLLSPFVPSQETSINDEMFIVGLLVEG